MNTQLTKGFFCGCCCTVIVLALTESCTAEASDYGKYIAPRGGFQIPAKSSNGDEIEHGSIKGGLVGFETGFTFKIKRYYLGAGIGSQAVITETHGKNDGREKNNFDELFYSIFIGPYATAGYSLFTDWSIHATGRFGPVYNNAFGHGDFTYGFSGGADVRYHWGSHFLSLGFEYYETGKTKHDGLKDNFVSFGPVVTWGVKW